MNEKKREPLFHIVKRDALSIQYNILIKAVAIVLALILCALLTTLLTGKNPLAVYASIWKGAFGTSRKMWMTFRDTAILLIISLALTPSFKMKFWNIGGEGQVLMGALATAICMITLAGKVPNIVLILIMIASSILAGALWAFIPAICKALWNTNETLSTLMMNYIATQLVAISSIIWAVPKNSGKIGIINGDTNIGWFPDIAGNKHLLAVLVAIGITVFMYIYLKYSKHGYEISVVGGSENTARYAGIKVGKVIVRTVCLSGAVCGIAGLLLVASINHTVTTTIAGGLGFTAVLVSWLAKFNPVIMVFASMLIAFLSKGAGAIATEFNLDESLSDILTGIILFFIIGCEFFARYKIKFNKKKKAKVAINDNEALNEIKEEK